MNTEAYAGGSPASDYRDGQDVVAPSIGRLVLLPATHVKPNQWLVNNETGEIEIVNKGKFFSSSEYSRYYIITEEPCKDTNLVYWQEGENDGISMFAHLSNIQKSCAFPCYPAANSIIKRLHEMYYSALSDGKEEYIRFTKIHNDKYAGFPGSTRLRIPPLMAKERWSFIFNHVLMIRQPNNIHKKRVGVLFGTIAGADPAQMSTIKILEKYRSWIIS